MALTRGQVALSIPVVISIVATLGSGVIWTYSQISAITTHAAQTDINVATVTQKTEDVDARLSRIETKLDTLIQISK